MKCSNLIRVDRSSLVGDREEYIYAELRSFLLQNASCDMTIVKRIRRYDISAIGCRVKYLENISCVDDYMTLAAAIHSATTHDDAPYIVSVALAARRATDHHRPRRPPTQPSQHFNGQTERKLLSVNSEFLDQCIWTYIKHHGIEQPWVATTHERPTPFAYSSTLH